MTFHGKYRGDHHTYEHAHESPMSMLVPLGLLSFGAVFAGTIFYSKFMGNAGDFWHGALPVHAGEHHAALVSESLYAAAETTHASDATYGDVKHGGPFGWLFNTYHGYPWWVLLSPLFVSAIGFITAYVMYMRGQGAEKHIKTIEETGGGPLYNFLLNKWYIDEIYDATIVRGARALGDLFWKVGDQKIIDGLGPNGVAAFTAGAAKRLSKLQTGYLFHYAFVMLLGVAVIIALVFRTVGG